MRNLLTGSLSDINGRYTISVSQVGWLRRRFVVDCDACGLITTRYRTSDRAWQVVEKHRNLHKVQALHHGPRTERHGSGCIHCGIVWPCPTIRALDAEIPAPTVLPSSPNAGSNPDAETDRKEADG